MTNRQSRAQRRLARLGWVVKQGQTLLELYREYQGWHGLVPDGVLGPQTLESIEQPRFCGLPDRPDGAQAQGQLCKWLDHDITWTWIGGGSLGHAQDAVEDAFREAWARWARVCGIRPQQVATPAQADVVMGAGIGREAGPSGTLAWSEMPCSSSDRQLQQRYDTQEQWTIDGTSQSPRGIDLVRVACHEIGHAIGLPHQPAGNLMAPTYSRTVHSPQQYEIGLVSASRMYGPAVSAPQPPQPPPGDPGPAPGGGAVPPADLPEVTVRWRGKTGRMVWE